MIVTHQAESAKAVTINACKLCSPLGACLAFRGIANSMTVLHGSQGCATYIRRYIISHFKEPMDIASSSFNESTAIFGGKDNLLTAIRNVAAQYHPEVIGVATTCLSETIGDDIGSYIREYSKTDSRHPELGAVTTPGYQGTPRNGFQEAIKAVCGLAGTGTPIDHVNLFPGFVSPADLRYLKEILNDFGLAFVMLPDYSETLDGPIWSEYMAIPPGGTPLSLIQSMGRSKASIELGRIINPKNSAAQSLNERCRVPGYSIGMSVGVRETDNLFEVLTQLSGHPIPDKYRQERERLIDSYIDGHKYLFGKKAVIYGEADLVVGLAGFLAEIGVIPILCASGEEHGRLAAALAEVAPDMSSPMHAYEGADFSAITIQAEKAKPDLIIGNSKGYAMARQLKVPLVRVGFPVHDRIDGARILHLGYRGTQQLFDRIVNGLMEQQQNLSPVGYSYI